MKYPILTYNITKIMVRCVKIVIKIYMGKSIKVSKSQKELNKAKNALEHTCYHLWMAIVYKLYSGKCVVCSEPGGDKHHVFPKGSYPHLKYDWRNGVVLCRKHHDDYHFAQDKDVIEKMISAIGIEKYSELVSLSKKITKCDDKLMQETYKELKNKAEQLGIV